MRPTRPGRGRGFTLLEVMIALAILGAALVVLLRISSQDVRAAYRAKLLTVATALARSKMYDLEAELYKNGFSDSPETENGDFSDESQAKFKWEATIEKVVLPQTDQLTTAMGQDGQGSPAGGGKDVAGAAAAAAQDPNQSALLGLAGGSSSGALGASMVQMYFPLISPILENAIRKVSLTVSWKIGSDVETLKVICFFTDTKAIDQAMPGAASSSSGAATGGTTTGTGGTTGGTRTGTGTGK